MHVVVPNFFSGESSVGHPVSATNDNGVMYSAFEICYLLLLGVRGPPLSATKLHPLFLHKSINKGDKYYYYLYCLYYYYYLYFNYYLYYYYFICYSYSPPPFLIIIKLTVRLIINPLLHRLFFKNSFLLT